MKIFVSNHRFNVLKIFIGGTLGIGKHVFGVENIQTFVFHRPHIEVTHSHHHEDVQIIFQTKPLFIPTHGALQRGDGIRDFVLVLLWSVEMDGHFATWLGDKFIFTACKVTRNHGKQITGLAKWIDPFHIMTLLVHVASCHLIAIGKQHWITLFVCHDGGREFRHHIRTVEIIGDLPKAFWFTLSVQIISWGIQTHQTFVFARVQLCRYFQNKTLCWHWKYGQSLLGWIQLISITAQYFSI